MKKSVMLLVIILFSFSVYAVPQSGYSPTYPTASGCNEDYGGVKILNFCYDCGADDNFCPEDYDTTCGAIGEDNCDEDCSRTPDCDAAESCSDGIQNQGETGIDCGGPCAACSVDETCSDSIKNQDEVGVDCGGVCVTGSEVCNNLLDDDNDCLTDCSDLDCSGDASCVGTSPEECTGGIDEDGDGLIDCADSDCAIDPNCMFVPGENCGQFTADLTCNEKFYNDGVDIQCYLKNRIYWSDLCKDCFEGIDCSYYKDGETCAVNSCGISTDCYYSDWFFGLGHKCYECDASTQCDYYIDEDTCVTRNPCNLNCEWDSGDNECIDKIDGVVPEVNCDVVNYCSDYVLSSTCNLDECLIGCYWSEGLVSDSCEVCADGLVCSDYSVDACLVDPCDVIGDCSWDPDTGECEATYTQEDFDNFDSGSVLNIPGCDCSTVKYGECKSGKRSLKSGSCIGCSAPEFLPCKKISKFPAFTNLNILLVSLILIGYYFVKLKKRRK